MIKVDKMFSPFAGLDSAFLYAKDLNEKDAININVTSKENLPKLNIWSLRYEEKADLLPMVLRPEDIEHMCAVIMLDFDQPWEMKRSLEKWMKVLQNAILDLMKNIQLKTQDRLRNKLETLVKTYEEP